MPSEYISQLIRQAATPPRAKKTSNSTPADIVPPSEAEMRAIIEDERSLLEASENGYSRNLEVRPGVLHGQLWWPTVIVSRIVPGPLSTEIRLPNEPEVSGREYARVSPERFMASEWPGLAVANLAGVQRLELSTEPSAEHDAWLARREALARARAEIMAQEDEEIFRRLDELGQDGPQMMPPGSRLETLTVRQGRRDGMTREAVRQAIEGIPVESVQFDRNTPFSMSFWGRTGPDGQYGWHVEPTRQLPRQPPHDPAYLEPSYVNNPAERVPLRAERVQMPEFEIVSNPTIPLSEIRERRFNLVDRVRDGSINAVSMGAQVPYQMEPPPETYTNVPRPYCPTSWERLLGDDPV